jgi:hypothetical protein
MDKIRNFHWVTQEKDTGTKYTTDNMKKTTSVVRV